MAMFYGYGRHSTHKQGITQEVQYQQLVSYWQFHLAPQGIEWGGWFYDTAQSGGKPLTERPMGRAMWSLAKAGDHVGWAKLDRAFRSVRDGSQQMHLFEQAGISVHSIDLRLDTGSPLGKFVFHVLMSFAELERQYASIRTKEALATRAANGNPRICHAPIGWKKHRHARGVTLVVNEEERAIVRRFFDLYQNGWSLEQLQLLAMREGLRRGKWGWERRTIRRGFAALLEGFPNGPVSPGRFRTTRHRKAHSRSTGHVEIAGGSVTDDRTARRH